MSTPIIGLTTYNQKNKAGFPVASLMHSYVTAVREAGGAPLLIPSGLSVEACQSILGRLDGLLLTGGGDIAVERFEGEHHARITGVDPDRDALEFTLIRLSFEAGLPFLGICRGFQVVNVALGGTLYTHIQDQLPGAIKHDYDSGLQREFLAHEVRVAELSYLAGILQETNLEVNSLHHQGVKDLAPLLSPVAHAPDGLVEAVEVPGHRFGIAVQWHPEWLTRQPATRRLFQAFVEAAINEK